MTHRVAQLTCKIATAPSRITPLALTAPRIPQSMSRTLDQLLAAPVPDPTDFPAQAIAPGLRQLDGALRCTICGELFDGPVSVSCGHSFCSGCIRATMATKQECPICRHSANEGSLRVNIQVEDIVTAWKAARPYMLKLAKEDEQAQTEEPAAGKKRKRGKERGSSRSPLSPERSARLKREPPADDDIEMIGSSTPPSADNEPAYSEPVDCPACHKRIKYGDADAHLGSDCKRFLYYPKSNSSSSSAAWSKLLGSNADPGKARGKQKEDMKESSLPKVSYDTLKDKKIRELLADEKLPTTGDRSACVTRHKKWVMLYNANLDRSSANRKTRSQLQRELKKWEEDVKPRSSKKPAVEDAGAYVRTHSDDFKRLIEQARASRPKKEQQNGQLDAPSGPSGANEDGAAAGEGQSSSTTPCSGGRPPASSSSPAKPKEVIELDSSQESAPADS